MSGSDPRLAAPFQGAGEPYCSSSVCGGLQRSIPMFMERQRAAEGSGNGTDSGAAARAGQIQHSSACEESTPRLEHRD